MAQPSGRIEFIDLAKGICILLVVFIHVVTSYVEPHVYLNTLRMPLYFCLSGLFFKDYGGTRNFMIKKTNKILIPFIAWYLIGYAIRYTSKAFFVQDSDSESTIFDLFYTEHLHNFPIWFLLSLFWSNFIFFFINGNCKTWISKTIMVVLVSMLGIFMAYNHVFNFLYLFSSMTCLPFFYLGYILKKTPILYSGTDKKKDFIIMSLLFTVAAAMIIFPENPPVFRYMINQPYMTNPIYLYITATCMVCGVLLMCKFIKKIPFISWLGRYSIIILVCHGLMKLYITAFLVSFLGIKIDTPLKEFYLFMGIIISMLVVIPFCKKFLPYITAQKDLIKIKAEKETNKDNVTAVKVQ